ncbi:MAG TPA: 2,3-bisphosphoglycerate-independent phosphoglycerate mutase, partial [Nitrospiraceae bacterium]|nr:2,3-bisphosphoglycerate-independent phosphoglycerate mutase [Nitrospiraceae bacterium]
MQLLGAKPFILVILDGWGIGRHSEENAIEIANIPFYRSLLKGYPNTALETSGEFVGLPEGQMGNSEVGHLNLGAGRIVYQDYTRINKAIREGEFFRNPAILGAMDAAKDSALHLLGLVSDGGVHSHINHLYALIEMALNAGVKDVFIHAFMDGRDTSPTSGIGYIKRLESFIKDKPPVKIATVTGRYWAMDRDKRWERIDRAYRALVNGSGRMARSAIKAMEESYRANETDEFITPTVIINDSGPVGKIRDKDAVIFFNFRADRARELTMALNNDEFTFFHRKERPELSSYVTMTAYDETFPFPVAFPSVRLKNILGEVISNKGLRQLRIAETEKYAHVTYFFNGGEENPFSGENRCLIPSPKDVPTYDLKPEMSAYPVTEELIKRIDSGVYDFIVLNFANPDMVGHTGVIESAVKACETIDKCLSVIVKKVMAGGGLAIITADHGNCEEMRDGDGLPHTAHTMNPVPFILLKKGVKLRERGILADVAPTILELMGIKK